MVLDVINNYFDTFTDLDVLKQREILKMFIESAVWDGETVEINLLNTKKNEFFYSPLVPTRENSFINATGNICR